MINAQGKEYFLVFVTSCESNKELCVKVFTLVDYGELDPNSLVELNNDM